MGIGGWDQVLYITTHPSQLRAEDRKHARTRGRGHGGDELRDGGR